MTKFQTINVPKYQRSIYFHSQVCTVMDPPDDQNHQNLIQNNGFDETRDKKVSPILHNKHVKRCSFPWFVFGSVSETDASVRLRRRTKPAEQSHQRNYEKCGSLK